MGPALWELDSWTCFALLLHSQHLCDGISQFASRECSKAWWEQLPQLEICDQHSVTTGRLLGCADKGEAINPDQWRWVEKEDRWGIDIYRADNNPESVWIHQRLHWWTCYCCRWGSRSILILEITNQFLCQGSWYSVTHLMRNNFNLEFVYYY